MYNKFKFKESKIIYQLSFYIGIEYFEENIFFLLFSNCQTLVILKNFNFIIFILAFNENLILNFHGLKLIVDKHVIII